MFTFIACQEDMDTKAILHKLSLESLLRQARRHPLLDVRFAFGEEQKQFHLLLTHAIVPQALRDLETKLDAAWEYSSTSSISHAHREIRQRYPGKRRFHKAVAKIRKMQNEGVAVQLPQPPLTPPPTAPTAPTATPSRLNRRLLLRLGRQAVKQLLNSSSTEEAAHEAVLWRGKALVAEVKIRLHETEGDERATCLAWTGEAENAVDFPATEDAGAALSYKATDGLVADLLPKDWNTTGVIDVVSEYDEFVVIATKDDIFSMCLLHKLCLGALLREAANHPALVVRFQFGLEPRAFHIFLTRALVPPAVREAQTRLDASGGTPIHPASRRRSRNSRIDTRRRTVFMTQFAPWLRCSARALQLTSRTAPRRSSPPTRERNYLA